MAGRGRRVRFDSRALFEAMEKERWKRGISWQQVAEEVGIAASTLRRTALGGRVEGDGMLAMARWTGRSPESFLAGAEVGGAEVGWQGPVPPAGKHLRLDTRAMHALLDERRSAMEMTWAEVAAEVGVIPSGRLTRLAAGGRVEASVAVAVAAWLGRPVTNLARVTDW